MVRIRDQSIDSCRAICGPDKSALRAQIERSSSLVEPRIPIEGAPHVAPRGVDRDPAWNERSVVLVLEVVIEESEAHAGQVDIRILGGREYTLLGKASVIGLPMVPRADQQETMFGFAGVGLELPPGPYGTDADV